jgi:hypothetical protein
MRDASAAPRNSRELAVRNQFFTPRYVVEFLTDNTLGRTWYEMMQGRTVLKEQCRYLVRRPNEIFLALGESAPETPVADNLSQEELLRHPVHISHRPLKDPREIRLLDPACGSMHFGLYAFDLFEAIYAEAWDLAERSKAEGGAYTPEFLSFARLVASFPSKAAFLREVPRLIIEHNIHGIDIDPRAAQVAGLSLWLRAQRTWYRQNVSSSERPAIRRSNIVCAEPMPGEKELLREFVEQTFPLEERSIFQSMLEEVFEKMQLAGEAGSLLKIEEEIHSAIATAKKRWREGPKLTQGFLFGNAMPGQKQNELDLSGITDEQFWDRVEDRIYAALGEYASQTESTGYARRLFAEDAAKGFAFIEVSRKRYDAVVMNPPFGQPSQKAKARMSRDFSGCKDIYSAFVQLGLNKSHTAGLVGAITSRTGFFQSKFKQWRIASFIEQANPVAVADLGEGVLDAAMVETAAYCLRKGGYAQSVFFRLLDIVEKETPLGNAISQLVRGISDLAEVFIVAAREFTAVPGSPLAYWVSRDVRGLFRRLPSFESEGRTVRQGLATCDDFRFVRAKWEIPPSEFYSRWFSFSKGGIFSPYYADIHLAVNWKDDGSEIKAGIVQRYPYLNGNSEFVAKNTDFYFKPGYTYPLRTTRLCPQVLPAGTVISVRGSGIFGDTSGLYLALLSSLPFDYLIKMMLGWASRPQFDMGDINETPVPFISGPNSSRLSQLALNSVAIKRDLDCLAENTNVFIQPLMNSGLIKSLRGVSEQISIKIEYANSQLTTWQSEIDAMAFDLYGIAGVDRNRIMGDLVLRPSDDDSEAPDDEDSNEDQSTAGLREAASAEPFLSYAVGTIVGRWDIRYATGECQPPELPDSFAPLPVCPPGMLQNAAGLPAGPEDVPTDYPVKYIPWDGILVDDPEHPLDIERRVREVIEIIWTGENGAPNAAAIEAEACELLEVRSLREYFRKPAGFFVDHLKRYSKSRRKAPIYWPLSTPSGGYTIWLYYHRLNDGTLYKVVEQFVEPKQAEVQTTYQTLAAKESRTKAEDKELEDAKTLMGELAAFRDDLLRLAKIWKPNLNDGVVITAAPLWRHFRLPAWQKELRTTWESLERGEYDWAHLAYSLWPERVTEKCKTDRSMAIAHNLEHLCTIEPPKPKKKRIKAKVEAEEQEGELL